MNKRDLVRQVGQHTRLTNTEVEQVLEACFAAMAEALAAGERLELQGLFTMQFRDWRTYQRFYAHPSRQLRERRRTYMKGKE